MPLSAEKRCWRNCAEHDSLLGVQNWAKRHQGFWWSVEHETERFSFDCDHEAERETVFDEVASALENVHPELTFEFSSLAEKREFVISAGGIKDVFPFSLLVRVLRRAERETLIVMTPSAKADGFSEHAWPCSTYVLPRTPHPASGRVAELLENSLHHEKQTDRTLDNRANAGSASSARKRHRCRSG